MGVRTVLAIMRFSRGMTQEELAERADVAKNTVQRLERGELPTLKVAIRVAEALDADVSTLFLADRDEERVA